MLNTHAGDSPRESGSMTIQISNLRVAGLVVVAALAMGSAACTTNDTPDSAATGPGIENPAGVPPGSIQPGIGGAGNGGGVSGGGSGTGGMGQGAR